MKLEKFELPDIVHSPHTSKDPQATWTLSCFKAKKQARGLDY